MVDRDKDSPECLRLHPADVVKLYAILMQKQETVGGNDSELVVTMGFGPLRELTEDWLDMHEELILLREQVVRLADLALSAVIPAPLRKEVLVFRTQVAAQIVLETEKIPATEQFETLELFGNVGEES